jgi:hypothetical protein
MLSLRTLARGGAFVFLLTVVIGCGSDGPKVVPVTGSLTYKGKPVASALLNFLPEKGRQSWAETDAEGKFKVNYDRHQDGAVVGKHKVWIEYRPNSMAEQEAVMMGKAPPLSKEMKAFFDRYSQPNSKLEVQIDKGTKDLKLELD